ARFRLFDIARPRPLLLAGPRVHLGLELFRLPVRSLAEPVDERQVLRFVVGRRAGEAATAPEPHALAVLDDHPQPSGARVATGRTVGEQPQDPLTGSP